MSELRVMVVMDRWSGHEGGTVATVKVNKCYGLYDSTEAEIAEAKKDADRINQMLALEPPGTGS